MSVEIRKGACVLPAGSTDPKGGIKADSCPVVWDRKYDIRLGLQGYEIVLTCDEGRAFAGLILEAVRRAEERRKQMSPTPQAGGK